MVNGSATTTTSEAPSRSFKRLRISSWLKKPGRCAGLTPAEGELRTCLFSMNETDLREPLRAGATADGTLTYAFVESVKATYPFYAIRLAGGALFLAGMLLMTWSGLTASLAATGSSKSTAAATDTASNWAWDRAKS